ncbi:MAG: peptidase S41 [Deltaproteobacteria bacterium]|nr:MAG: peptidase S41 [Deltaproteobacteria bacterium]
MRRLAPLWKPLVALAAVLGAFTITFVWPVNNGLDIDINSSPRALAARNREPYDLTRRAVLNRAILEVKDHYVEPDRVRPKAMLLSGLNAIQRTVAPVLVHYEQDSPTLTVQVNDQSREYRVDDVNSPWALANRFREIFSFLQQNLEDEDIDLRDIEYAAVNGMLRTLDPHTVLLTPDVYEEMRMSTRGEFGGLGIVISIRDGQLTIIKPMDNTPASRAGLHAGDQIVKINDESTLNMPLSEAVDRLRGAPGSSVDVYVVRDGRGGFTRPRRFELVRAVIHIDSIEHRMLGDDIGYISIKSFQGNTYEDMRRALSQLHREGMRGLVLDLRDDPGGLLDQAVRVSDAFLSSGNIVTTASNDPTQRDEKFARQDGTEPDYPMIVLVNGGSASASEIVAGALQAHDRALIVGQRTFGKGSVQVLYDFQDGSALKLTIAQYLTPGDVSIQGVGIVPDIAIDPMTVDREDMDLAVNSAYLREADLRSALTSDRIREAEQSATTLRYYLSRDERQRLRDADPQDQENEEEGEFLLRFSRELLSGAQRSGRREMLSDAAAVLEGVSGQELGKAVTELRRIGVDWSTGPDLGPSDVDVQVTTNRPDDTGLAGEPFEIRVRVTNRGDHPLYQLRAQTKSDYRLFDGRELVFGRLDPGQTREWSTTLGVCEGQNGRRVCTLPRDVANRADGVRVEFEEANGHAPEPGELRTRVTALPRPQFAYSLQVADTQGNGDGRLQRGERASLYLRVRNVGRGRSYDTRANLRNLSGRGVLLRAGRFTVEPMEPGDERVVEFQFEVLSDFEHDEAKLEVSVIDTDLREYVTEKIDVPIVQDSSTPTARTGNVSLTAGATVRAQPDAGGEPIARSDGGAFSVPAQATLPGWVRVDLGDGRPGWVADSEVGSGSGGTLAWHVSHMPPRLEVDYGGALVTRNRTLAVSGTARDDQQLRDLYIFVGSRKVYYQPNRGNGSQTEASFETEVTLTPGINYITVFARESDDVISRETFVVRRDGPDGAHLETPQYDDHAFGAFDDVP